MTPTCTLVDSGQGATVMPPRGMIISVCHQIPGPMGMVLEVQVGSVLPRGSRPSASMA